MKSKTGSDSTIAPRPCRALAPPTPRNRKEPSELIHTDFQGLLGFASGLFPVALACECCLDPFLFTWIQIEGMFLDLFNDVLLLDFPFKAAKGVFKRLTLLYPHFRHTSHPLTV